MIYSNKDIICLFEKHWDSVKEEDRKLILKNDGGIDPLEAFLLYISILEKNPELVIEMGPNKGYSSIAIAAGMRNINKKASFVTFEINWKIKEQLTRNLINAKLYPNYISIIMGDAIQLIPKILEDEYRENDRKAGIIFIDSNHTEPFAKKYIKKIFPLLSDDCLVVIHDIKAEERSNHGHVNFGTSLFGGTHGFGEENAVRNYLKNNNIKYLALHSMTGGTHEGANLPINKEFYSEIEKITGINLATNRICPKSLWFNVK
jgi:predicted O-methyltransferase YrrM